MYFISFLFALLWNGPHQCIAVIYIMFLFVILSFANVNAENIMQKIVASDNVGRFGYSVSMHNNTALVGSYDMMGSSGSAYIFDRIETVNNNSGWTQTTKLVANDSVAPGDFGISVSIDNNIALIASFGDAYIFEKQININQVLWTQTARLVPNDGTAFINFGYSVSIHNNSALISSHTDDAMAFNSGSAYIFEKVNEIWIQTAKLVPNDGVANDYFGTSVSIHNNIALIGSRRAAYIFEKVNRVWTQTAQLVANDGDAFGTSVSINNNIALIGSRRAAYIFEKVNRVWTQTAQLVANDGDAFGTSVSINNNIALIGSPYNDAMGTKSGSAYIFEKANIINATWTQTAKLVANDGIAGDQFGMSVSIDNNIALIASFGDAYIFEKQININQVLWTQTARLVPNDGTAFINFGYSVSIHNNSALIGWPGNGIDSGSAYIFEKVNEIWIQTAKLVPNDAANDHFGTSVSIHNNIALIGSPSPGHAYIFEKVNGAWTQTAKLVANDGVASDNFGTSVSINNNIALIGSPYNDDMGSNSGSAYIFEKDATWTQTAKLVANDGVAGDQFGRSVSIDNNIALIGAWMGSNSESGSAYIFEKKHTVSGFVWVETKLFASNGAQSDRFGYSVAIYKNFVVIGAYYDDSKAGSAYIFEKVGVSWVEIKQIFASDRSSGDYFGNSVSIHENIVAVGAYQDVTNGSNSGSVYVFEKTGTTWPTYSYDKLNAWDGAPSDDIDFGRSVSVYNNTVLVGSYAHDINNKTNSGAAYIFEKIQGSWTQTHKLFPFNGSISDYFGFSVSLFENIALIGSYLDDDMALNSGSAYIFEREINGNWIETEKLVAYDGASQDLFGRSVSIHGNHILVGAYYDDDPQIGMNTGSAYMIETHMSCNDVWNGTTNKSNLVGKIENNYLINYKWTSCLWTDYPTKTPTNNPTKTPTNNPTKTPTNNPTKTPTNNPTKTPTNNPTKTPTNNPT
eukprot:549756_1